MKEKELSLGNFMAELLLHWRGFIVMMLVGAIFFGALGYGQSLRSLKKQEARIEAAKEELARQESDSEQTEIELTLEKQVLEALTDLQIREVKYVRANEAMLADKRAYMEKSVLMQIDPSNVKRADLTFLVSSDDPQKSHDIEKIYEDIAGSGELIEYIAAQLECEVTVVNEGISFGRVSSGMLEDTNTFKVTIRHYDEAYRDSIAQAVIDFINKKHEGLQMALGEHEITLVNQSFAVVTDINVLNNQRTHRNDIEALENTIANNKAKFTAEEWDYYDFLVNGELTGLREEKIEEIEEIGEDDEEEAESPEKIIEAGITARPGISVKYVVVGAFLLAFLYGFAILVAYVLNNKLRSTDQLQALFEIPQLGTIYNPVRSRKLFGFIDKWIISLRDRNKRKFTGDEALKLAAVAVKMAAKKEKLDKVCLVGCDLKGQAGEVCASIRKELEEEKIVVSVLCNVLYDAQMMSELEGAEGAVLVECAGVTLYNEITQELELLKRQKIKVLGGITVEV